MKLKTILSASAVMMIALASCKKDNPVTPVPESKDLDIKVSASLYQFTKATDTAFEENDNIGLFILTPETYLDNAKFTVNNAGALVPATAYKWYDNKDLEAALAGYYPYNENWTYGTEMTFTVNADQSTAALYTASDLMLAAAKSKPTEEAVALPFKHVLSKIIVTVDNQLEGDEEIADVYFSEIYGQVTLDPKDATTITSSGSKGTVKALKGTGNTWSLIVAPQTEVSPKLIITTKSEKQYTYVLEESVNLNSGKYSTAEVVLNDESIYTSFTASIEDWVADNELNFNQDKNADTVLPEPAVSEFGVVGTFNNWGSDVEMTIENGYHVAKNIALTVYDSFKIRKGGLWDESYGAVSLADANTYQNTGYSNIIVTADGTYDIYLSEDFKTIYVMEAGKAITEAIAQDDTKTTTIEVYAETSHPNLHAWISLSDDEADDKSLTGEWPGLTESVTETVNEKTYKKWTVTVSYWHVKYKVKVILNGDGDQTEFRDGFDLSKKIYVN